jgi:hypothetical protein
MAPRSGGAQEPAPAVSSAPSAAAASPSSAPKAARQGAAVLALAGATEPAWSLARQVYASSALRPAALGEPHARVLAGEAPVDGAAADLRELAETRAAIRGDDAPSRQLLASIAATFSLRAIVVVDQPAGDPSGADGGAAAPPPPRARLFLAEPPGFDAATFSPDAGAAGKPSWDRVVRSLERTLTARSDAGPPAAVAPVVVPVEKKSKEKPEESRPFYASAWFWGALGGAAFLGTAIYFASRDSSPGSIHLSVQVPP